MKAFLLSAGFGTRLKPLTDEIPKCLVPIKGKPLLEWWLELLEKHNIDEVLINLHHLPKVVENFINSYKCKIKIHLSYEKELLGSAGTLLKNEEFIINENYFYIMYADNLTNINLTDFLEKFKKSNHDFGMTLFRTDDPKSCGIAEIDKNSTIINFEEKPKDPKSNLANGGVYIAKPNIIKIIPKKEKPDIGFDLIPKLINKTYGYETNCFLMDIGTHKNLKTANENWEN